MNNKRNSTRVKCARRRVWLMFIFAAGTLAGALTGCSPRSQTIPPQPATRVTEASSLIQAVFRPWSDEVLVSFAGLDVETVGDVDVSGFALGTSFDSDGRATGTDYFQSDSITFSFTARALDDSSGGQVAISVDAPGEAGPLYSESEALSIGKGGTAQFTIMRPDTGWPSGDWVIHVLIGETEAKAFEFGSVGASSSDTPRMETADDALGLSPASELWRITGYINDPLYNVQVLGQLHELIQASAAGAYMSDDGTKVFTAYPAALDASDGSVLWEGEEYPEGSVALEGNGVYQVEPIRRVWPSAQSFTSADSALKGLVFHEYEDEVIGWQEVELLRTHGVRPEAAWEIEETVADPSGRYWLFYERPLASKPGTREKQPGNWEWMVYDSKAKKVVLTRSGVDIGYSLESTPVDGDTTHVTSHQLKVFADGRVIIGNRLICPDPAQDRDVVPAGSGSVRGISLVEGRLTMVIMRVETEPAGSGDNTAGSKVILYDTEFDKRFPIPEGCGVESASRDGLTVLCTTSGGENGLMAWRLEP